MNNINDVNINPNDVNINPDDVNINPDEIIIPLDNVNNESPVVDELPSSESDVSELPSIIKNQSSSSDKPDEIALFYAEDKGHKNGKRIFGKVYSKNEDNTEIFIFNDEYNNIKEYKVKKNTTPLFFKRDDIIIIYSEKQKKNIINNKIYDIKNTFFKIKNNENCYKYTDLNNSDYTIINKITDTNTLKYTITKKGGKRPTKKANKKTAKKATKKAKKQKKSAKKTKRHR